MNTLTKIITAAAAAAVLAAPAAARESGIADSMERDCGIWLCLPQAFPGDQAGDIGAKGTCSKSFKTYIRRLTELVGHHHPKRRWTSLPAFSNCNQSTPEERNHTALNGLAGGAVGGAAAAAGVAALSGNGSSSSAAVSRSLPVYSERDDAHIPEHDECTSVIPVYRRDTVSDDEEIVGYQCRAWKHVEDHYELGKECDLYGYDGSPAEYSRFVSEEDLFLYEYRSNKPMLSFSIPNWCDYTVTSTDVYGDQGEKVGNTYRVAHESRHGTWHTVK